MLCLAIDTSTPTLVAGIVDTLRGELAAELLPECRKHNEVLIPTIQHCAARAGCTLADLDAIVVGCGPGPFTGLRVGMATAAALGDALQIPVHGVVSHDSIAQQLLDATSPPTSLVVATDARRREVYWSRYDHGERVAGPEVHSPAHVAELLDAQPADVLNCPTHIDLAAAAQRVDLSPTPAALVAVADLERSPEPLVPLYLRRPDAAEPAPQPLSPAIPDIDLG
ncbi:tRNA threonylcarbamoyladenosine biosynthesis protein TsaB [Corynebacterium ciconiae DSM 44920]|uniref:tRNA (adenosine(37)-N6)-threonylcarbamoyltransferase complex dimerization subunit type 1 TsaB n=1 Tax=Corynebacterium ciconiae TaxID=227319 RepID=UPI00036692AD|nr:tRNA (adenosine(37)-N6)-threonylcarbamoyltransferase complex dimerization subunit type 1 TsaB [Corynebacterium ciconiae]WKD60433.1 tRNA threonylcarbamoyladenosine biosynthesis protein TsaB [Corynebacterium ciconiae DSM 44920]